MISFLIVCFIIFILATIGVIGTTYIGVLLGYVPKEVFEFDNVNITLENVLAISWTVIAIFSGAYGINWFIESYPQIAAIFFPLILVVWFIYFFTGRWILGKIYGMFSAKV